MHVVIVGGGFAGLKTALELSKRHVGKITLISDKPYFLHHATLYATAMGKSTEESVIPLATIIADHPSIEIIEDTAQSLDPHRKLLRGDARDYHYDKLVLALGSTTSFKGVKGLSRHAFGVTTLAEIREFQDHIQDSLVRQKLDKEFFVIGAGLTGVEIAAALRDHLASLVSLYRLRQTTPRVTLVERESRILPHHSARAARTIAKHLKHMGIRQLTNCTVTELSGDTITINGQIHSTSTAIWTSGVANNPFYQANRGYFTFTKSGKVRVNPYLEALDDVYVIGDNNDVRYSGMSLPALKQATHVAKNITRLITKRPQLAFRPSSVPLGLPVGSKWGYVEWFGLHATGSVGKVLRRWMELYSYCQLLPFREALPIWRSHDVTDVDDIF